MRLELRFVVQFVPVQGSSVGPSASHGQTAISKSARTSLQAQSYRLGRPLQDVVRFVEFLSRYLSHFFLATTRPNKHLLLRKLLSLSS